MLVLSQFSAASVFGQETWVDVREESILVSPSSPLDFSRFNGAAPAGQHGRITIGKSGKFEIAGLEGDSRFHCASLALSPATGGFPKGKDAEAYARQLKSRGYNVARFHYVEATLMTKRDEDFSFDPVELDAWFNFLAMLKKHGIYWVMDGMSSENGALGAVYPHRWIKKHDFKRRIYFDASVQEHWKKLVADILVRKNPYTGKTTLEDEALLGVITVNEGGVNHLAAQQNKWPAGLQEAFNGWLKERYRNDSALRSAWGGNLSPSESIDTGSVLLPEKLRERTARMRDLQRFITQLEVDNLRWMQGYLRELGYKGPVSGLDSWPSRQADLSRQPLSWIDMHGYHDESFGFSPGTRIEQTSSLDNSGRYLRWLAAARQKGKPFTVTEYGQPFWNRFRYEASVMAPAMASLQGWDFICLHGEGAVDLSLKQNVSRKKAIHPYGIGIDPVTIAGETLAALLMRRGDISPAKGKALINFSSSEFAGEPVDIIEDDISSLGWLMKLDLDVSRERKDGAGYNLQFEPGGVARSTVDRALKSIPMIQNSRIDSTIDAVRKSGVITAKNASSSRGGVFQSDNEQVTLDRANGIFRIVTPLTQAVSSNRPVASVLDLGTVQVMSSDSPGLISISSLDDLEIKSSRKLLIIFATDAQNTGMSFSDSYRRTLSSLGSMPPQIRGAQFDLSFTTTVNGKMSIRALALNGDDLGEVPADQNGRTLKASVKNTIHGRGVVFFLLEIK